MNALELADVLDRSVLALSADAAAELRRLYEVNQELLEALNMMFNSIEAYNHDGTPTIPYKTQDKAYAAIAKAEGRA